MKTTGKIVSIAALAAIVIGLFIFMKQDKIEISSEGYIGRSEIAIEDGKMGPEALLAFGRMSDPQVSPDGKYILYGVSYTSVEDNRSVRNLYICNLDGSDNQLLTMSGKSISNARWSKDGKKIVFLYGGQIWTGDIRKSNDGWSLKNLKQISDVANGIGEFKISPDEKKVMYISYIKSAVKSPTDCYSDLDKATAYTTDDLMYRHWDHTVMEIPHTFVADLDINAGSCGSGKDILEGESELFELPTEPFGGLEQLSWSPDSRFIAYSCRKLAGKK
jgi:Tol biopolymer transport system component